MPEINCKYDTCGRKLIKFKKDIIYLYDCDDEPIFKLFFFDNTVCDMVFDRYVRGYNGNIPDCYVIWKCIIKIVDEQENKFALELLKYFK